MEQILAFIGQLIWQARIGLVAIGWNAMAIWDSMGDTWHRVLAVVLLFVLFFLLGGLVATIGRYCEARQAEREQPEEVEQPRADTGALFAVQVPIVATTQEDLDDWQATLASIAARNPERREARIGAYSLTWAVADAEDALTEAWEEQEERGEL